MVQINISSLCKRAGMTRQNFYATRKRRKGKNIDRDFILDLVRIERKRQPRLGGRKLLYLIKPILNQNNIFIGRDLFFNILRDNDLLIEKKKSFRPKTTNSRHSLPIFRNILFDLEPTAPNQVWVADLTYIRTLEGFVYGALITDQFSRKIVGAYAGDSLEAEGCIKALNKALKDLPENKYPIHHSDRGCQYCCHAYVDILRSKDLSISMTEINHCYENAMAERINGILKQEYNLDYTFPTKSSAIAAFYDAIELYNNCRPHMSLNYEFPNIFHTEKSA